MDNNILVVSGRLYPGTASLEDIFDAEGRSDRIPLVIVETPGGTTVVGVKDLKAADPMAYRALQAHLDGQWLMILPRDGNKGLSLTDRELHILSVMPLDWGEHGFLIGELGVTRRQLQRSLENLLAKGLIESPSKGYYRRL